MMAIDDSEYARLAEAALFVSGDALSAEDLAKVIGVASVGAIGRIMEKLISEYEQRHGAIMIAKVGSKYIMSVRSPYSEKVSTLAGQPDISHGALRILAYVSKNEPIMQSSIVKSFGSSTYDYMKELLEKEFVSAKRVGRTKRIETTPKFKEYFEVK